MLAICAADTQMIWNLVWEILDFVTFIITLWPIQMISV